MLKHTPALPVKLSTDGMPCNVLTRVTARINRAASFSIFDSIQFIFWDKFKFSSNFRTSNSKLKQKNGLDIFRLFSTFNSEYPEFKILFKPNLALENLYLFYISDEDDFYMKILALSEIYNLLVFSFFI